VWLTVAGETPAIRATSTIVATLASLTQNVLLNKSKSADSAAAQGARADRHDARRGQFVSYHGSHITIPGGPGDDGIFNAISEISQPGSPVDFGSSFIQVVTWQPGSSCPVGSTILTYSESSNPTSPHFADQTKLFSKKQFLPDRFCPKQIAADPNLRVVTVTGR